MRMGWIWWKGWSIHLGYKVRNLGGSVVVVLVLTPSNSAQQASRQPKSAKQRNLFPSPKSKLSFLAEQNLLSSSDLVPSPSLCKKGSEQQYIVYLRIAGSTTTNLFRLLCMMDGCGWGCIATKMGISKLVYSGWEILGVYGIFYFHFAVVCMCMWCV